MTNARWTTRILQLAIALLLTLGLTSTLLAARRLTEPDLPNAERQEVYAALLLLGIAPLSGAMWLKRSLHRQHHQTQDQHLRNVFYTCLQQGHGRVNVLQFSMQAHLSAREATAYLSDRAREFDATFDVDEAGGITYCFNLGDVNLASTQSQLLKDGF
jgi:hypothetical protein